jgi:hypothetical protein
MVYAYYDNPDMLRRQLGEWMMYPPSCAEQIEFIVVDDGSPHASAMSVVTSAPVPMNLSVYRVQVDRPWGQDGARNIGMHECGTPWALMTDMDHLLACREVPSMLGAVDRALRGHYYMPMRVKTSGDLYHPHPNSFLFNVEDFWKMGGYDEDFVGFYGSDGNFRKCAQGAGLHEIRTEQFRLILFGSNDVHDANTRTLTRKEGDLWAAKNPFLDKKRRGPAYKATRPFRSPYVRQL